MIATKYVASLCGSVSRRTMRSMAEPRSSSTLHLPYMNSVTSQHVCRASSECLEMSGAFRLIRTIFFSQHHFAFFIDIFKFVLARPVVFMHVLMRFLRHTHFIGREVRVVVVRSWGLPAIFKVFIPFIEIIRDSVHALRNALRRSESCRDPARGDLGRVAVLRRSVRAGRQALLHPEAPRGRARIVVQHSQRKASDRFLGSSYFLSRPVIL